MTAQPMADEPPLTDSGASAPPRWEFPEVAAVVVLVAVGLLALGGLATGLALVWQQQLPSFSRVLTGRAVGLGGGWANVPLAGVLLGAIGLCWWTRRRWEPRLDDPSQSIIAAVRIGRCGALVIWTQAALVLTALASIAQLVGAIMVNGGVTYWASDFNVGANMIAVLVIAVTGVLWGRRLTNR